MKVVISNFGRVEVTTYNSAIFCGKRGTHSENNEKTLSKMKSEPDHLPLHLRVYLNDDNIDHIWTTPSS